LKATRSPDEARKEQQQRQTAELAEFSEKIKTMFRDADPKGTGTIGRPALARVFRELDISWTPEDLDDMLTLVGGGSGGDIRYADFVDWFMMEEDPKLRKQLWQSLSNAFSVCEAEEQDDPEDDDDTADLLQAEEDIPPLDVNLDQLISYDLWQGLLKILDIDEDDGLDMYEEISEEMESKGKRDIGKGFPMREFLQELRIKLDDREGVLHFVGALEEAKEQLRKGRPVTPKNPTGSMDQPTTRTLFNKVVKALDKARAPAEDGYRWVLAGKVRLSKAEQKVFESWKDYEKEFVDRVAHFMESPPIVSAVAGQTACNQECIRRVDEIIKKFEETGTKFTDPEWNVRSSPTEVLYVDKERPGWDCTVGKPARWKRLTDIAKASGTGSALNSLFGSFASGPKKKIKPALFKGGIKAGDIVQGNIGTCFLLGAMGAIASDSDEAIQRMFIRYDVDAGVYGLRFNVDGEWDYVIVDDYMPVDYDGNILYAHSKDAEEVWVALLEKAFCKLHTCYEMCDGGMSREAIACMLGGVGNRFIVKKSHHRDPGSYFKVLKQARAKGWLLTSGFIPRGSCEGAGKCGEAVLPTGLVGGHAYSVLKVVEAHGHKLVCCRNPWGEGEWTGKWSDENADGEWTEEMKAATGYRGLNDGRFWMSIEDFVANTAGVDYARTFGPNWKKLTQFKRFRKAETRATAQYDYEARDSNEISFRAGDKIEVTAFTGSWWCGNLQGRSKEGYFPGNYVQMDDRPVSCFELVGTPNKGITRPMTAVVMLLQPNAAEDRRWIRRKEDGLNYKDLSYPCLQMIIVSPDGGLALKREGKKRNVWGELLLPGGGRWRIYALSTDGQGDRFIVRAYVKDGTATLRDVPGATMDDLIDVL